MKKTRPEAYITSVQTDKLSAKRKEELITFLKQMVVEGRVEFPGKGEPVVKDMLRMRCAADASRKVLLTALNVWDALHGSEAGRVFFVFAETKHGAQHGVSGVPKKRRV